MSSVVKKIGKAVKSVVKSAVKLIKKAAPLIIIGAAIYFGGAALMAKAGGTSLTALSQGGGMLSGAKAAWGAGMKAATTSATLKGAMKSALASTAPAAAPAVVSAAPTVGPTLTPAVLPGGAANPVGSLGVGSQATTVLPGGAGMTPPLGVGAGSVSAHGAKETLINTIASNTMRAAPELTMTQFVADQTKVVGEGIKAVQASTNPQNFVEQSAMNPPPADDPSLWDSLKSGAGKLWDKSAENPMLTYGAWSGLQNAIAGRKAEEERDAQMVYGTRYDANAPIDSATVQSWFDNAKGQQVASTGNTGGTIPATQQNPIGRSLLHQSVSLTGLPMAKNTS